MGASPSPNTRSAQATEMERSVFKIKFPFSCLSSVTVIISVPHPEKVNN